MMTLEHQDLTERIIGAAIEVHRRLGRGFLESLKAVDRKHGLLVNFAKITLEAKRVIAS